MQSENREEESYHHSVVQEASSRIAVERRLVSTPVDALNLEGGTQCVQLTAVLDVNQEWPF